MATYTESLNTNYNFPNIDIYNRYKDGVLCAYRAYPKEGYIMYDSNDELTEPKPDPETGDYIRNPETGEIIEFPVTNYFTMAGLPLNYNFNSFSWVAVSEDRKDETNESE